MKANVFFYITSVLEALSRFTC